MNTITKFSLGATVLLLVAALIIAVQNMTELKSARQAVIDRDQHIERLEIDNERLAATVAHEQGMNKTLIARLTAQAQAAPVAATIVEDRLARIEQELQNKKIEIAAQAAEQEMLVERVEQKQQAELEKERNLTVEQRKIRDAQAIGTVSEVQQEAGFAVIDAGKQLNVEPGIRFAIRRDTFIVGKVEVTSVEEGYSIVDIVTGSVQPGQPIKPGDAVIAYPVY